MTEKGIFKKLRKIMEIPPRKGFFPKKMLKKGLYKF